MIWTHFFLLFNISLSLFCTVTLNLVIYCHCWSYSVHITVIVGLFHSIEQVHLFAWDKRKICLSKTKQILFWFSFRPNYNFINLIWVLFGSKEIFWSSKVCFAFGLLIFLKTLQEEKGEAKMPEIYQMISPKDMKIMLCIAAVFML